MHRFLRRFAYLWLIIIGGLIIFFGPGGIVVECIACLVWGARFVAVVSIALGVWSYFNAEPMPGRA